VRFSYAADCAACDQEPATFECRICGSVENDMTFDQTGDVCEDCQNKLALREIEDKEKR